MDLTREDDDLSITENDLPQEFILKLLGQHEARGLWGIKHTRDPVDAMVKYAKTHDLSLPIVQVVITKEGIFMTPIHSKIPGPPVGPCDSARRPTDRPSNETKVRFDRTVMPVQVATIPRFLKLARERSGKQVTEQVNGDGQIKRPGRFNLFVGRREVKKLQVPRPVTDLQTLDRFSRYDWRKSGIFFFGIDTISYGVQDLLFTRVFSMIVVLDRKTRQMTGANSSFMCHAFVCDSRSTAKRVTYALAAAFQAYARSMKHLRGSPVLQKPLDDSKPKRFTINLRPPTEYALDVSEA